MHILDSGGNPALTHPLPLHRRTGAQATPPKTLRWRRLASELTIIVGLLAFVFAFLALRFTLYAHGAFAEQKAISLAAGAMALCIVAVGCSILLREPADQASPVTKP